MAPNPHIAQALARLDPKLDEHWTEDGQPKLEAVAEMLGVSADAVSRDLVTAAGPDFTRAKATELHAAAAVKREEAAKGAKTLDDLLGPMPETVSDEELPAMQRDFREVMASPDLLVAVIRELDERAQVLRKRKDEMEAALKELYAKSELATRQLQRLERGKPNQDTAVFRQYLDRQKKARAERAERARKFVEAGTTAGDVAKHLASAAPIDAALNRRKPGLGTARPSVPVAAPE